MAKAKASKKVRESVDVDVEFTDEIPSITREGRSRSSKYEPLLAACRERAGKAATMTFDSQGKATSRYQSIKTVVDRQEDADEWTVTTRSDSEAGEWKVFVGFQLSEDEDSDNE